jgi:hypothetical protein
MKQNSFYDVEIKFYQRSAKKLNDILELNYDY